LINTDPYSATRSHVIDTNEVHSADSARRKAMIAADVDRLTQLFAEDMVWIHGTGRLDKKEDLLETISSQKIRYLAIDYTEQSLRVISDLVFINGVVNLKLAAGGEVGEVQNRFTIVWKLIDDRWQVVHWQSTSMPKA
jgi:ketosteroid isomerase-like protein